VGARRRHGQEVAAARLRKLRRLDQDVAGLAVLAGDAEDAVGELVRAVREQGLVPRLVELRARVVGHAAVDRDVADAAALLDDPDAVEREAGAADERAPRLEHDLHRVAPALADAPDEGGDELLDPRHGLLVRVPDPEAAAEVDDARRPRQLMLRTLAEGDEPVDREKALVDPRELRADVEM